MSNRIGSMSIKEEHLLKKGISSTNVASIMSDIDIKDKLEQKAFSALESRLTPMNKECKKCKGDGGFKNGEICKICNGEGFIEEKADMRAIELVLSPKFPKTQINVNAEIDNVDRDSLLKMIDNI